jgi:hypothetical protein
LSLAPPIRRSLPLCTLAILLVGCHRSAPPAALTSVVTDSAGVPIVTLARPLAEIAEGSGGAANDTGTKLFDIDSLEHPVAVTFINDGSVAIVDRTARKVVLVDSIGRITDSLGRRGDGPGDLQDPAGVAALGRSLIVLQSYPTNTLTRFTPGSSPKAVVPPIAGDWDGWKWEQRDIGLEFPIQSAPEIWSRRLRAFDDSTVLAYVGPVDSDTSPAALAHLLRLGADLRLRDTVASFVPPHRIQKAFDDPNAPAGMFREVWGARPVWGAGDGMIALARSNSARVEILDGSLRPLAIVRWTPASLPVTEADRSALGDRILRVTLAAAPGALERYELTSEADRKALMSQFMASFSLASTRPELTGLFVAGGCLWIAGFDVNDDADGTAHEWLVLDLTRPAAAPRILTLGEVGERVVAIERGKAATIRLGEDGFRRVRVYRVPSCRVAS